MALNEQFSRAITPDFFLESAKEAVKNHTQYIITMQNKDIDAGAEETVWQYGGIYTYLTAPTGTELFVSCSNVADTGQVMQITGLKSSTSPNVDTDLSYSTNGRTAVSIGTWYRIFGIRVLLPTDLQGDLYCATADTLVAGVPSTPSKVKLAIMFDTALGRSENTANHAGFTPPVGFFALIRKIRFSGIRGKSITYNTLIRPNQGTTIVPWQDAAPWQVFENNANLEFSGIIVDELWDIEIRAHTDSANTEVTVIMDILLIRKD
tara:strand:+ start:27126 stop:27917 length:792 start_codon:yes stop_codon:yes gene_type:complete